MVFPTGIKFRTLFPSAPFTWPHLFFLRPFHFLSPLLPFLFFSFCQPIFTYDSMCLLDNLVKKKKKKKERYPFKKSATSLVSISLLKLQVKTIFCFYFFVSVTTSSLFNMLLAGIRILNRFHFNFDGQSFLFNEDGQRFWRLLLTKNTTNPIIQKQFRFFFLFNAESFYKKHG